MKISTMKKFIIPIIILAFIIPLLAACQQTKMGTLLVTANGEDFIRQGFRSKDGWSLSFEQVLISLTNINAYQTDPPYVAEADSRLTIKEKVSLKESYLVDLAAGDENAEPISIDSVSAPVGHYNAVSWEMVKALEGALQGNSLQLVGWAEKDGQSIPFTISFAEEYRFFAGEYVGDVRKGFVNQGEEGEVELTLHFDHLFGDFNLALDAEPNSQAIGFAPFAALAVNGEISITAEMLKQKFTADDYQRLIEILPGLAHVGEGHAIAEVIGD